MVKQKNQYKYYAFISYSHNGSSKFSNKIRQIFPESTLFAKNDMKWGIWLQKKLESYRLPAAISKNFCIDPKQRIKPVFRDENELGCGVLDNELHKNLDNSKYLIVLCSPNSANPNRDGINHIDNEIKHFISKNGTERVIPVIVNGIPNDSEQNCFPPEIKKHNFVAIDLTKLGKEHAFSNIVAKMLNLAPDELWEREKRRLIRRRILLSGIYLFIFAIFAFAGYWRWDRNRDYEEYYIDYTDKRGIPTGIFKLNSPVDIKSNHIAFIYQGRSSLFGARILRRVEVRSPAGHLVELDKKISDKDPVQVLHYNEKGNLTSIDIYDENRKKQFSKELKGEYFDFKLPSINQKSTYDMFQSSSGMHFSNTSMFSSHAKISRWKIIRNETSGFIEKIIFYATGERNALPAANAEGICGGKFERDQYGRETLRNFLDAKGNLIVLKDGTYAIKRVYNGRFLQSIHWLNFQGKSVKEIRLDINPVNGLIAERLHFINGLPGKIDDVFKVSFEYYPNGLRQRMLYFDGNGNRCFKNDSCFGCEYFYYPNGKTHKIIYLNPNNKPMISPNGNAGTEFIFDEKQRIKSIRALAVDCMSSATTSMGTSEMRITYKKQTNDIEQVLFF